MPTEPGLRASQAYCDESVRGSTYLLAVSVVSVSRLAAGRTQLRGQLLRGQRRLHFVDERPDRRRQLLAIYSEITAQVLICTASFTGRTEQQVRDLLPAAAVAELRELGCRRLVIESREGRDDRDRQGLRRALPSDGSLIYEHLRPFEEPLLWLADGFAWAHGKGDPWAGLISCPLTHTPLP